MAKLSDIFAKTTSPCSNKPSYLLPLPVPLRLQQPQWPEVSRVPLPLPPPDEAGAYSLSLLRTIPLLLPPPASTAALPWWSSPYSLASSSTSSCSFWSPPTLALSSSSAVSPFDSGTLFSVPSFPFLRGFPRLLSVVSAKEEVVGISSGKKAFHIETTL